LVGLISLVLAVAPLPTTGVAAEKKKCTASQELALLDINKRLLSLNLIYQKLSTQYQVEEQALQNAAATGNKQQATKAGTQMSATKRSLDANKKTQDVLSANKKKLLGTCTPKPQSTSGTTSGATESSKPCNSTQLTSIRTYSGYYDATLRQIEGHELEIYAQKLLLQSAVSQGSNSGMAKAQSEIQRRSTLIAELSAYASVVKKQFEVANSSCANSGIQLAQILTKTFVPNSLVAMNINRWESSNQEITRPILNSQTGNLGISCDSTATNSSSYSKAEIFFALTTKKPEIWDRYNGAGSDVDAFTVATFKPNYIKQPDSTFTFPGFSGGSFTFQGFKAQTISNGSRQMCDFGIVPIVPSEYATDAVGIWYFVIATEGNSQKIWSLMGFTISNYLNPFK
jgi:hypothetical protein